MTKALFALALFLPVAAGAIPAARDSVPHDGRLDLPGQKPIEPGGEIPREQAAPAPIPPAPSPPQNPAPRLFDIYGFFLPGVHFASGGIGSFGRANLGGPTEATLIGRSRQSFQMQQSRFGVNAKFLPEVKARLEIDFTDLSKASPTVQTLPRLRILKVEYEAFPKVFLFAGQDWDLFSPLGPFSYNFIGGQFRAGNAGFLRQQVGVTGTFWSHLEAGASLGFGFPNAFETDQAPETEKQFVYSAKAAYARDGFRAGVSGIYSRHSYYTDPVNAPAPRLLRAMPEAYGINLFTEFTVFGIEARAEGYHGQNLGGLNLFTLGQPSPTLTRIRERGAYLSARRKLGRFSVWTTVGFAAVQNPERINDTSRGAGGIRRNRALKFGGDYGLGESLRAFYELSFFGTSYPTGRADETLHSLGFYLPF